MEVSPRVELRLCHIYLMTDLLMQHFPNRIADYIAVNHYTQTSSKWDRISAQIISRQTAGNSFNYAHLCVFRHLLKRT